VKQKRFAVEQIVAILKQAEAGLPVVELIRKVGISEPALSVKKGVWESRGGSSAPAQTVPGRERTS